MNLKLLNERLAVTAAQRTGKERILMRLIHQQLKLSLLGICLMAIATLAGCASNPAFELTSTAQPDQQPENYMAYEAAKPLITPPVTKTQLATELAANPAEVVRAQNYDGGFSSGSQQGTDQQAGFQQNGDPNTGQVQPAAFQYPENGTPGGQIFNPTPSGAAQYQNSPQIGSPNEMNSLVAPSYAPSGAASFPQNFPQNYADLDVYVAEDQTGRINIGGAYNSDNGIVGQFIIDEKNFDIRKWPRNFRDISNGAAWRGAGQQFRLEIVPGSTVQRYLVSFTEPYLFDTGWSFNLSGYLFDRGYFDWDEQRIGGRFALGYRLSHDLSLSVGLRAENVEISNPRVATSPQLNAAVGDTDLYLAHVSLVSDTRDHPFLATEGSYLSMTYSQGFGEFDFPKFDIDYRRYRLLYQRPDTSGRHTLSYGTKLGFSGAQTPVFENYYAGGFSTMRGFDFRGASPVEGGAIVGGEFQWLNTLEYMFPLTADDMIKGVLFCDFGTVEQDVEIDWDNFRVAPGFGFRVHMPAAGIGAPLAFDFAFPISDAMTDNREVFSFYLGMAR